MEPTQPLTFPLRRALDRERDGALVLEATIGNGVVVISLDPFRPDPGDPSVSFTEGTIGCADTKAGAIAMTAIATWLGVDPGKKKARLRKAPPVKLAVVVLAFDASGELGSKLLFEDADIEVYFDVSAGWTRGEFALKSDAVVELATAFATALRDGPDHDAGITSTEPEDAAPLTIDQVIDQLCGDANPLDLARAPLPPLDALHTELVRRLDAGERNGFLPVRAALLFDALRDPAAIDFVCRGLAHRVARIHVLVFLLDVFRPLLRAADPEQRARLEQAPVMAALEAALVEILAGDDPRERAHRSGQIANILAVWGTPSVDAFWERQRDVREPIVVGWYAAWAAGRDRAAAARWAMKRALMLAERSELDAPRKAEVAVVVARALATLATLPATPAERQQDDAAWSTAATLWPRLGPRPTPSV
jgi:hypothetical protein